MKRQQPHKRHPLVAVVYPVSVPWMAECLRGIKHYADSVGGWQLVTSPPSLRSAGEEDIHLPALRAWRGDGVVACLASAAEVRLAARLPMPVVNLSGWQPPGKGVPRVNADHRAIGRVAAEHLLSLGMRHFAYYGMEGPWFSAERERGFVTRLAEAGHACEVFRQQLDEGAHRDWQTRHARLSRWLAALPRPVGLLAVHDYRARVILELCARQGLAVPGDIAVLGVDNDPITCDYCVPTLSSVSRDPFACGQMAAELLDRLMQGQPMPHDDTFVAPAGIVARASTNFFHDSDPIIRRVASHAARHVATPFTVAALARSLNLSRRTLELKFRDQLGVTPLAYLRRCRVNRAKTLLIAPDGPRTLDQIARTCGFRSLRVFRDAFRAETGMLPTAFRDRHGIGAARRTPEPDLCPPEPR